MKISRKKILNSGEGHKSKGIKYHKYFIGVKKIFKIIKDLKLVTNLKLIEIYNFSIDSLMKKKQ